MQWLWVPGQLMTLNEMLDAQVRGVTVKTKSGKSVRVSEYSKLKAAREEKVVALARGKLPPVAAGHFTFLHVRNDRRVDPDNFSAGARKTILDGLQTAGVIRNDGWKQVLGFTEYWICDALQPGVLLGIADSGLSKAECVAHLRGAKL